MNRRSRFITGFLAAALTFGGLMATLGPEPFYRSLYKHHHMENCCMDNDNRLYNFDEPERYERHYRYERFRHNEPAAAPVPGMKADSVIK